MTLKQYVCSFCYGNFIMIQLTQTTVWIVHIDTWSNILLGEPLLNRWG